MNQGFIQTPVLIAILVGVTILGGIGYVAYEVNEKSPVETEEVVTESTTEDSTQQITEVSDASAKLGTMILDKDGEKTYFYMDSTHVWISGEMPPDPILIPDADSKTFEPLKYPYSRDVRNVYFWDIPIQSADSATFRVIYGSTDFPFGADQYHVFSGHKVIEGADPATFKFNSETFTAQDKNREYELNVQMFVK